MRYLTQVGIYRAPYMGTVSARSEKKDMASSQQAEKIEQHGVKITKISAMKKPKEWEY